MSNWSFLEAFIYRQSCYDNCKCSLLIEISSPGVSLYRYLLTAFQLMLLLKRTKTAFPLKYFIIGHLLVPASPSLPPFFFWCHIQSKVLLVPKLYNSSSLFWELFPLLLSSWGNFLLQLRGRAHFYGKLFQGKEPSFPIHDLSWLDVHHSRELQWSPVV